MDIIQQAGMDPGRAGAVVDPSSGPAGARFAELYTDREAYLRRARRQSKLTVPYLFRDVGENSTTDETLPWQSLGSYGVDNISAQLVNTLFPPGIPFVELSPTADAIKGLAQVPAPQRQDLLDAVDKGLAKVEKEFIDCVEEDGDRLVLFEAILRCIVGGNQLVKVQRDATLKAYTLEQYVVMRDVAGTPIEFVTQEGLVYATLPDDIKALCKDASGTDGRDATATNHNPSQNTIAVYTHGCLRSGLWTIYQEVRGKEVPGSRHTLQSKALNYIFPSVRLLAGENYSRSYVEGYEADLQTLDGYYQVLTEGGAAIAQLKWLVKPGSTINKKQFAEAQNGAVMTGDPEDIGAVKADKGGDLSVPFQMLERIEKRLESIFIMQTSIQRNGERVTAEEIRFMAQQLDTTLGGMYSNLVATLQRPYAELKLAALQRLGRVTKLPPNAVKVTILTGEAGLGRQKKAQALDEWATSASAVLTPPVFATYIKPEAYLVRSGANKQVETDGLVKTADEVQAEQQQQQQAEMMKAAAPAAVTQLGGIAQNSQQAALDGQAQPPAPPQPQQPQGTP